MVLTTSSYLGHCHDFFTTSVDDCEDDVAVAGAKPYALWLCETSEKAMKTALFEWKLSLRQVGAE